MAWLKNHPFAVEALLARITVVTFAAPIASLQPLIPECLTLDTFADSWGFLAVAMVQTSGLRPAGLPACLGRNFFLIGYRVFVRFTTAEGKRLRGLYILKSETDKWQMEWLGNLFTGYHYATIDIEQRQTASGLRISSNKARLTIEVSTAAEPSLPEGSPFASWQQARRFAGPLPFTFSYEPERQQVTIVEGKREDWVPRPVCVDKAQVGLLEDLGLEGLRLASAFTMADIPYHWQKGRTELWHR
ncbi:DUF2071 domain-containing protein [Hymenobacter fodinae]|uniref:DUF2071 domain-containing protein n=1 Tax=Hymenobacter fodinae TaxID=2510796 RepID=A0A4Z0P927_9BACT|nr:DUF2071 domain-containing protein [Hymenobacter fodinae]TGE08475.1 hypothetical protein EU556_12245 [Hymenobacter fodinae]